MPNQVLQAVEQGPRYGEVLVDPARARQAEVRLAQIAYENAIYRQDPYYAGSAATNGNVSVNAAPATESSAANSDPFADIMNGSDFNQTYLDAISGDTLGSAGYPTPQPPQSIQTSELQGV